MSEREKLNLYKKRNAKIAIILAIVFSLLLLIDFIIISLVYSWADWVATLIFSLLLITPSFISNAGMVILGGGNPIDRGKKFIDRRPLFGNHKTWKGLILGPLLMGIPISIAIYLLFLFLWPAIFPIIEDAALVGQYKLYSDVNVYRFYFIGGALPIGPFIIIIRIIFCAYGAGFGDLLGSFLKRRFDIRSGSPFWIIDQLDFILVSILFTFIPSIFFPELYFIPDINIIIFLLILTPTVDIIANNIAYLISLKDVPW